MQAAREYLERGELRKAAEEFQRTAKGAEASRDDSAATQISCLLNAGACLVSLGEHERGFACLRSAGAAISAGSPSPDGSDDRELLEALADIHYNSAVAYQALGDNDQAAREYQCCVNIHEKSANLQATGDTLDALAACHHEAGELDKEVSCLEKARRVCQQLGDSGREATLCATLARAHLRGGREADSRQMLSTAKMIGSRVDDKKILGSLYSQCGLVHSSLGQHDEALRSFEQALPLVRGAGGSDDGQQREACLLQNIGATYNEKQMYSESLAYHSEAATMHGRLENREAELKSLCNLAFAQTQLQDYTSASATLSDALEKAHASKNTDLQFQVLESLGGCNYHMSCFPEAERAFTSALELLDDTEADTGRTRERVTKKLSDVREALRKDSRTVDSCPSTNNHAPPPHSDPRTTNESTEQTAQESRASPTEKKREKAAARPDTAQSQDSCDMDIQAYEEALSSTQGSSEALEEGRQPVCSSSLRSGMDDTTSPLSSSFQGQGDINPQLMVTEGSLAIGTNARDTYTVRHSRTDTKGRGKRHKIAEIVRRDQGGGQQEDSGGLDDTDGLTQPHSVGSVQHSKTCTIL